MAQGPAAATESVGRTAAGHLGSAAGAGMHGVRALTRRNKRPQAAGLTSKSRESQVMISEIRCTTRRLALAAGFCMLAAPAFADSYPSHPIRLVHGFAPGGAADTLSRIMAERLSRNLGQPVVVEAKPGAGG